MREQMKQFRELLTELNACSEAKEWAGETTIEQVVQNCHRGDWLLWLARKVDVDLRILTLAKARCAKTVIHLMKDERSINTVNVAEQFGLGNATREELNAAYAAAYAAADAAYADADAAAYAAAAAAYAAAATYAAAYADADAAAYAAAYADADAAAVKSKNQLQTADICREILGEILIKKVNDLLK